MWKTLKKSKRILLKAYYLIIREKALEEFKWKGINWEKLLIIVIIVKNEIRVHLLTER